MTRWRPTVTVLISCLTLVGCFHPSSHRSDGPVTVVDDSADIEVLGWVDRVEGRPRIGSSVTVVGWAGSRRPECRIEKIEILLDGMEVGETAEGVERSDVAEHYGNPSWSKSGWEADVLLDKILPGEHKIEAVARDAAGVKHALSGGRSITVLDLR